jgi:ribonuclease P protein component
MENENHTLCKAERLHSRKLIEKLFGGGQSRSMSAFPLRVVYLAPTSPSENGESTAMPQMLVSVPKRYFKRAVKRNRIKRQVREAYRRHKFLLDGQPVIMAFIWLDAKLYPSTLIEERVVSLISRIKEKIDENKNQ